MFKQKTVFVVGAGGSHEVGLPVGDGLARNIADKLKRPSSQSSAVPDERIRDAMYALAVADQDHNMIPWFTAAETIANSMPLAISIDNFLHTHSDNKFILATGKLAIARCILEAEQNSEIYAQSHGLLDFHSLHERYRFEKRLPSWHNLLFKMLTENVKRSKLGEAFENVTIITFNYDRCIEHYLTHAFAQFMGIPLQDAYDVCANLEIVHPYGKVGDYFLEMAGFGADVHRDRLIAVSKQIRTFTEQVTEQQTVDLMAARLNDAVNIMFLGFSFGEMNVRLMETTGRDDQKNIVGSALGISKSNLQHIERVMRKALKLDHPSNRPFNLEDSTCHQVLADYYRLLMN